MKTHPFVCLFVVLHCSVSACAQEGATHDGIGKQDLKRIQGTWLVTEAIRDGRIQSLDLGKKSVEKFTGDRWHGIGNREDYGTIVLRGATHPKQVDITFTVYAKSNRKRFPVSSEGTWNIKLKGIYKIENDVLTLAITGATSERPKDFESPIGKNISLFRYQRVHTSDDDG